MTREETQQILMVMQAAYPSYHPANKTVTVNLWLAMLGDYNYQDVIVALQAYIATDTSGFAPGIGQIIDKLNSLKKENRLLPMEAWALVKKAIHNSGYHSREEFNKLPPDAQRAVGSPEQLYQWSVDTHFNEAVVMSQFIKSYQLAEAQRTEREKLPASVQALIENKRLEG